MERVKEFLRKVGPNLSAAVVMPWEIFNPTDYAPQVFRDVPALVRKSPDLREGALVVVTGKARMEGSTLIYEPSTEGGATCHFEANGQLFSVGDPDVSLRMRMRAVWNSETFCAEVRTYEEQLAENSEYLAKLQGGSGAKRAPLRWLEVIGTLFRKP